MSDKNILSKEEVKDIAKYIKLYPKPLKGDKALGITKMPKEKQDRIVTAQLYSTVKNAVEKDKKKLKKKNEEKKKEVL